MLRSLFRSVIALVLASGFGGAAFASNPDHYPYNCIKNNSGFITKINWYNSNQLAIVKDGTGYTLAFTGTDTSTKGQKSPTLGFTACNGTSQGQTVAIQVAGGAFLSKAIAYGSGAAAGAACLFASSLDLFATAPACGTVASGTVKAVGAVVPNATEIFYAGGIPSGCELHVSGTAFAPKVKLVKQSDHNATCTAAIALMPYYKK